MCNPSRRGEAASEKEEKGLTEAPTPEEVLPLPCDPTAPQAHLHLAPSSPCLSPPSPARPGTGEGCPFISVLLEPRGPSDACTLHRWSIPFVAQTHPGPRQDHPWGPNPPPPGEAPTKGEPSTPTAWAEGP